MVDYSRQINEGGSDVWINNSRIRNSTIATGFVVTPTTTNGTMYIDGAGTPASYTSAASTFTANYYDVLTGIITYNFTGSAPTLTLDTAANLYKACNLISAGISIGDYIQVLVINGSATNGITVAAGSGGSLDTNNNNAVIAAGASRYMLIRFTAVGTSPTYTVYF